MSDYLTPREVGQIMRFDPDTVTRWCLEGKIEGAVRTPGGRWRIPRATVEKILAGERE